jgi:DNA-directed RNA polymerase subunit RPC12/RpoP
MSKQETYYCARCGDELEHPGGYMLWCETCGEYIDPDIEQVLTTPPAELRRESVRKAMQRLAARKAIGPSEVLPFE